MRTIRRIGGRGRSSWRRRIRNHGERTTHKSTPPISTSSSYPHPSFLQSLQVSGPFASSLPPRLGGLRVRVGLGHTHGSCASALFLLLPSPSQPLPASPSTRCFFDTSFFRHECFCRPSPPPPAPCCRLRVADAIADLPLRAPSRPDPLPTPPTNNVPRPVPKRVDEGQKIRTARKLIYRSFDQHKHNPRVIVQALLSDVPENAFNSISEALWANAALWPNRQQKPEWHEDASIFHIRQKEAPSLRTRRAHGTHMAHTHTHATHTCHAHTCRTHTPHTHTPHTHTPHTHTPHTHTPHTHMSHLPISFPPHLTGLVLSLSSLSLSLSLLSAVAFVRL